MKIQTPTSHLFDPVSSRIAEDAMNRGKRFNHQETVFAFVKAAPGHTAAEYGFYSGLGQHEASRRLADLTGKFVKKGGIKKCPINKTMMVTWYPTE